MIVPHRLDKKGGARKIYQVWSDENWGGKWASLVFVGLALVVFVIRSDSGVRELGGCSCS